MIEVNLLPGAQRKRSRAIDFSQLTDALKKHFEDKFLVAAVATVTVALIVMLGAFLTQRSRTAELNERAEIASADSARFAKVLNARARAQASRDSIYQQLAVIRSIDNMRFTWAHLLEEVNIALPAYTWLTSVTQTSPIRTTAAQDTAPQQPNAKTKKETTESKESAKSVADRKRARADSLFSGAGIPTRFRILGQTVDIQALTLFMKNLEASPFIRNVQLTRSDLVMNNGKEVTEFQLEAESEVAPQSLIQTVPLSIAVK